jgi:hypothetical protein
MNELAREESGKAMHAGTRAACAPHVQSSLASCPEKIARLLGAKLLHHDGVQRTATAPTVFLPCCSFFHSWTRPGYGAASQCTACGGPLLALHSPYTRHMHGMHLFIYCHRQYIWTTNHTYVRGTAYLYFTLVKSRRMES